MLLNGFLLTGQSDLTDKFQLHFLFFYAHVSLKCPCYCVMLLSVSALRLVGAGHLQEIFMFWNMDFFFTKCLSLLIKFGMFFSFLGVKVDWDSFYF